MEEEATPFPSEETTPPVTKIYFGAIHAARVRDFPARRTYQPSERMTYEQLSSEYEQVSNRRIDLGNLENRIRELEMRTRLHRCSETFLASAGSRIAGEPNQFAVASENVARLNKMIRIRKHLRCSGHQTNGISA